MPVTNGISQQMDSHEDRLQRLEGSLENVRVSLAEVTTKQDGLITALEEQTNRIFERIDGGYSGIAKSMDGLHNDLSEVKQNVLDGDVRVKKIEDLEVKRAARWSVTTKIAVGIGLPILGVLGSRLGAFLLGLVDP